MAIIPSKFIFPLEQKVTFFEPFDLTFDNPRTDQEKKVIKDFLLNSLQFENKRFNKDNSELFLRSNCGIHELIKYLEKTDKDSFALKYYSSNTEKNLIDILAETWIIVRFSDNNQFENILTNRNQLVDLILSRKNTTYTDEFRKVQNISYFISLLANNEDSHYHGQSFLLTKNPYEIFYTIERFWIHDILEHTKGHQFLLSHKERGTNWLFWLDGKNSIIEFGNKLSILYKTKIEIPNKKKRKLSQKQSPAQKILHVGNYLRMAHAHPADPELLLILLVGIIEYLLTRSPDFNRFNVEDSITKQFKLKCAIAINNSSNQWELTQLNESLSNIYNQRSDIAHGNYVNDYSQDKIIETVLKLYQYLKCILETFVKNRELIEYLKDN